jgi:hypothetical protein
MHTVTATAPEGAFGLSLKRQGDIRRVGEPSWPHSGETGLRIKPITLDIDLAPGDPDREPGLHMSDLYGGLYQVLEPDRFKKDTKPAPALLALGVALEQYTERRLLAAGIGASRPPQFQTPDEHRIWFSPDLLIANGVMKGGEIKATFMSHREMPDAESTSVPPKFDKYVTQMKVYGHNLEINVWWLLAWFLKGKWEKAEHDEAVLARFIPYELTFTAREMKEEYNTLLSFGRSQGMVK